MDDKTLKERLNRPPVPRDLERRIRMDWAGDAATPRRFGVRRVSVAVTAMLFPALLLYYSLAITPAFVTAASRDIISDAGQSVGLAVSLPDFFRDNRIREPMPDVNIKMSKHCMLDGVETVHLHMVNEARTDVHLFVNRGSLVAAHGLRSGFGARQGRSGVYRWKLLHPRDDLTVLVLHTPLKGSPGKDPGGVDDLVRHMFYPQGAKKADPSNRDFVVGQDKQFFSRNGI